MTKYLVPWWMLLVVAFFTGATLGVLFGLLVAVSDYFGPGSSLTGNAFGLAWSALLGAIAGSIVGLAAGGISIGFRAIRKRSTSLAVPLLHGVVIAVATFAAVVGALGLPSAVPALGLPLGASIVAALIAVAGTWPARRIQQQNQLPYAMTRAG